MHAYEYKIDGHRWEMDVLSMIYATSADLRILSQYLLEIMVNDIDFD